MMCNYEYLSIFSTSQDTLRDNCGVFNSEFKNQSWKSTNIMNFASIFPINGMKLQGVPHQCGLNQYEFHLYAFSKNSLEIPLIRFWHQSPPLVRIQVIRFCIKIPHYYEIQWYINSLFFLLLLDFCSQKNYQACQSIIYP